MSQTTSSHSILIAGLFGCLVGGFLGVVGSQLIPPSPSRAAAPGGPETARNDSRRLTDLATAVDTMAASIEELRREFARNLLASPTPAPAVLHAAPSSETTATAGRAPVLTSDARSRRSVDQAELLERLEVLESIVDRLDELQAVELLIVDLLQRVPDAVGLAAAASQLPPIPADTSPRGYLAALKSGELDAAAAHSLWDTHRVTARYGSPDKVVTHDGYVEWIYWLAEEGEQFDFHFVSGLCVLAH